MLEQTLGQTDDDVRRSRQRSLERTRPPIEVPGFEPLRLLGSGAYGEVWLATERNTRRKVAIKFYTHRGGLDWSLLSREVEKLAFLFADRYVVQLIDVGWDADPPYYVMEYVEGGSLSDRLRAGPLPVDEAVALFHDVAVGLVHAHGKGVLHCDLTPGNVLIDQDNKPRLADFGQSRMSHDQTPALGTLFYMAPEQADLHAVPDAHWDVYALGALFYAMLTGQPPYRTPEAVARIAEAPDLETKLRTYVEILNTSPRPKAHRSVKGVDRGLAEIVDRAIAINPARRYANTQAILDALRARSRRKERRPLLVLGALGPAVLLLVISAFAGNAAWVSFQRSEQALVARSIENCRFAARFVAFTTAGQVSRRWSVLEREEKDPDFLEPYKAALGKPSVSPERVALQEMIEFLHATHPELQAESWFVLDAEGTALACSPPDAAIIDRKLSHRDFFHGQGHDLPSDKTGLRPISVPHRADVYESPEHGGRQMVFSVPVWDSDDLSQRQVIGVLAVAVPLGRFAELRPDEESAPNDQIAVLVDDLEDGCSPPRRGAILEHPQLKQALAEMNDACPAVYVRAETIGRMAQLRELRLQEPTDKVEDLIATLAVMDHYQDPLGGDSQERWLAAMEPVIAYGHPGRTRDTGLVVIVQEPYLTAVRPARQLASRLLTTSLIALVVVLVVITLLWAFVGLVLNDDPQLRRAKRRLTHALPSDEDSQSVGETSE